MCLQAQVFGRNLTHNPFFFNLQPGFSDPALCENHPRLVFSLHPTTSEAEPAAQLPLDLITASLYVSVTIGASGLIREPDAGEPRKREVEYALGGRAQK
jgi:hypothetical protein